jgi:Tfp pilus assembly protein PilO
MSVEKNIQLNRSSRRVLLITLGVIAAVGLYRWILSPYNGQLLAAQQYESTLDDALHKTNILGKTLEAKKAKIDELKKESDRLRNELFTPDEVRRFFASIGKVGAQSGCVIQSVSSQPEQRGGSQNQTTDNSGIVAKKATITVIGGYNEIISFLSTLTNWQQKVWIESMKMDVGGNAGKLKCQAVLTLYCIERMEIALYE